MRRSQKTEPLKIGIDARLAYRRGVGTYTANLVLAFARLNSKHRFFLFNPPEELMQKIDRPNFTFVDLAFPNAAYYEQVLLPRTAQTMGLDLLHYVDNSASAIGGIPFVLTLHDAMHTRPLSQVRSKPTLRQRLLHAYKRWAIARSTPKARLILTVSEYSKQQILRTLPVAEEKVRVTLEGVDLELFRKVKHKASKLFKILVHGAADDRKNIANILKATRLLADSGKKFQMVVVGMDEAEIKLTDYLERASALNLGRYVEWAGKVPFHLLPQLYGDVDLFLYPSLLEGFGLPVLEAFACGVPVVTSNTTSLPEVAGDAALLADPQSPEAIAQAVKKLMERPALRRALVQKGFRRAQQFSWDRTAQQTLKAYEEAGALNCWTVQKR